MITRSKKFIYDSAVALFLLVLFGGCAQTHANIRAEDAVGKNGAAVINAINTSSDGTQVEVLTDKPLSYTYYKTSDPPKIVIDLSQTEPGSLDKPLELNTGNIKRIEVSKHEFTGGFLTRVELILNKDQDDFTVATDQVDKGKLLINFPNPSVDAKQVAASNEEQKPPTAIATGTSQDSQQPAETQPTKTQEQPLATAETKSTPPLQAENKVAPQTPEIAQPIEKVEKPAAGESNKSAEPSAQQTAQQNKLLRTVSADEEGIVIAVNGGVDKFNAFKLTKPDRIVLDLPGVKSAITAKSIAIDKFAVAQVRQGIYPDKIRIVLDAAKSTLPPYKIIKNEGGLKVILVAEPVTPPGPAPVAEPTKEPMESTPTALAESGKEEAKPAVVEKKPAVKKPVIESIDFRIIDDSSVIAIKTGGNCVAGKPAKVAAGLSLTIKDCQVPVKLQRMIDTSSFPSVVKMITPYQVKMKKRNDARIMVKLRQTTTSSIRQDGDTLLWEIKNPENIKTAAIAKQQAPSASPPAETINAPKEKGGQLPETATAHDRQLTGATKVGEKKVYTGRRVSLEFSDADIRKILQLIAEVSNLNFLISDDVSGTISIKLINVPWDQALDVILDSKGLEKKQDGNIMYVKPKGKFKTEAEEEAEAKKARESAMELKTKVFDINFASVGDISSQFDKLRSDRGTIAKDERTNRVIVTDNEDRLEQMRNLLKELDMPEKQVMIEARIVEASSTFTKDLGVQWGMHYNNPAGNVLGMSKVDIGLGGIVIPPPPAGTWSSTGATDTSGGAAGITFGTLGSNVKVDLRLSAAATMELIKVISSPKVVTLNNKTAKISQGQNIPYSTVSAEGTKVEFIEAALTLEVTPHIANDGSISMKIKATNDSAGTGSPPPINKKEATTEVLVRSGETIVIGGIYQDNDTDSDTGVPWLKDIPLLGGLFKSTHVGRQKTELLIFITPKLVI